MYHKVYPESPSMWWVTVDNFYRQMCEIKNRRIVYLDEYDPENPDHVVITFDGVYKNIIKFAVPILRKFRYPFELFITGNYTGRDNSFDSDEQFAEFASIQELKGATKEGGRLQWHTKTHQNLHAVTQRSIISSELSVPDEMHSIDDHGFRWIAYPNGDFNDLTIEESKKHFRGAVSCHQGDNNDRYKLNRVTVTNETSFKRGKIAVIIASYNYGCFLGESIESVLKQTRPADEIIITDDCSTDDTMKIAKEYKNRYPQIITYNRNKTNLGIVRNFNKAVSLADADYICFLGADNRFRSDFIEKTSEILDSHDDVGIAYTDFALFGSRAEFVYYSFPLRWRGQIKEDYYYLINFPDFNEKSKHAMRNRNFIHGSSLYRKEAFRDVGGYKERRDLPEDHNLFLRIINEGYKAKRVPHPVLEYRQHSEDQKNVRYIPVTRKVPYLLRVLGRSLRNGILRS